MGLRCAVVRKIALSVDSRKLKGRVTANQSKTLFCCHFWAVPYASCGPDFESNPLARMVLINWLERLARRRPRVSPERL